MVVTFCKERTEPGLQADWRLNQRYFVEEISGFGEPGRRALTQEHAAIGFDDAAGSDIVDVAA